MKCKYIPDCRSYSLGDPNCQTELGGTCHLPKYIEDRKKFEKVEREAKMIRLGNLREICSGINKDDLDSIELNDIGLSNRIRKYE